MSDVNKIPEYEIEVMTPGEGWHRVASFHKGDMSRFGKPFDDEVAIMEVKSFKTHWFSANPWIENQRDFNKVRLIINF